ncbi:MAG: GNAT family N-acetyltransferase [Steroidobacteraceae bacterium]|nr:GNAT family N-acetyltransferase [Steroidobacteraceae bacterium]
MSALASLPAEAVYLRPATPDDAAAVGALLGQPYKPSLWHWQFASLRQPSAQPLVAEAGGQVVGFNGVLPVLVRLDGAEREAAWSCDFVVDPERRRLGIGRRLKQALQDRHPLLMAFGISAAGDAVHGRLGWQQYVPAQTLTLLNTWSGPRQGAKRLLQHAARLVGARSRWRHRGGTVDEGPADSAPWAELDALWNRVRHGYPNAVVRDARYLRWRYSEHPLGRYRAIYVRRDTCLAAVGFAWCTADRAVLADFLGERTDREAKLALVRAFVQFGRHSRLLSCTTSDGELQECLRAFGFQALGTRPLRFNIRLPDGHSTRATDWFLMGGDSDGDMLEVARSSLAPSAETWSLAELEARRREWDSLASATGADPLFLSSAWQIAWLRTFCTGSRRPRIVVLRDRSGRVTGAAPLFRDLQMYGPFLSRRLQLVGNVWRGAPTMRTEYLKLLAHPENETDQLDRLLDELLRDPAWDECILSDLDEASPTARRVAEHPGLRRHCQVRVVARFVGYAVHTGSGLQAAMGGMGQSARRRLFHQRAKLARVGNIALSLAHADQFPDYADRLDRLHALRWGRPFFSTTRRRFFAEVIRELPRADALQMSILSLNGRDVSALFNLRAGTAEYNLQGGFDEKAAPGVALGLLHLGYAIERAAADGVESFELLVGGGKQGDFKHQFASPTRRLVSLQIVRARSMRLALRAYDRWRGGDVAWRPDAKLD